MGVGPHARTVCMKHLLRERPGPMNRSRCQQRSRTAIALSGCPAMDVLRKRGKGYRRAEECATGL